MLSIVCFWGIDRYYDVVGTPFVQASTVYIRNSISFKIPSFGGMGLFWVISSLGWAAVQRGRKVVWDDVGGVLRLGLSLNGFFKEIWDFHWSLFCRYKNLKEDSKCWRRCSKLFARYLYPFQTQAGSQKHSTCACFLH